MGAGSARTLLEYYNRRYVRNPENMRRRCERLHEEYEQLKEEKLSHAKRRRYIMNTRILLSFYQYMYMYILYLKLVHQSQNFVALNRCFITKFVITVHDIVDSTCIMFF